MAQRGGGSGTSSHGGGPHIVASQPSGGCSSLDILHWTDGTTIHTYFCPGGSGTWTEMVYGGLRVDAVVPEGDCNETTIVYGILTGATVQCLSGTWTNLLGISYSGGQTFLGGSGAFYDASTETLTAPILAAAGGDDGEYGIQLLRNTTTLAACPTGYACLYNSGANDVLYSKVGSADPVKILNDKGPIVEAKSGTNSLRLENEHDVSYVDLTVSSAGKLNITGTPVGGGVQIVTGNLVVNGIDAGDDLITNVATPISPQDATNKAYVDLLAQAKTTTYALTTTTCDTACGALTGATWTCAAAYEEISTVLTAGSCSSATSRTKLCMCTQ